MVQMLTERDACLEEHRVDEKSGTGQRVSNVLSSDDPYYDAAAENSASPT